MGDQRLKGRRCLVTGAVGGQGAAVSRRFAAEGASLVVTDLDAGRVEDVAAELRDGGATAVGVAADVRDEAEVAAVVEVAVDALGGLDVLYNNAGVLLAHADRPSEELERSTWDEVLAINATGVFLFCKHAIGPLLEAAPGSVILNVGSAASYRGDSHFHAYAASKGALLAYTASLAQKYGPQGLRANLICPGFVETPMVATFLEDPELVAQVEAVTALRRMGKPTEIAAYAAFLASEEASYVTDSIVTAHGGLVK
ncbi:MAG: SDR family NAD(P)-dependent oxidoreductase [bacterium]|nr:SDR family NAD(P)-dependent oxidoreductase [bacterium]